MAEAMADSSLLFFFLIILKAMETLELKKNNPTYIQ